MKIIFKDYKAGELKIQPENKDDLWCISRIIEQGDLVSGKTTRKIKVGDSEQKAIIIKKTVTLTIEVEKVEYSSDALRVAGVVREGPEDIPHGSHHTLEVEENTPVKIIKKKWPKYMIESIDESTKCRASVLICILDRCEAGFALMKPYGFEWLSEITGDVCKKGFEEKKESTFYEETANMLADYAKRYCAERIVIASAAFWKDELVKVMQKKYPQLVKISTLATCNETGREGVNEILKRSEIKTALQEQRASREIQYVEELMKDISKDGNAAYGMKAVKEAAEAGAVAVLLVTDKLIEKKKADHTFLELDTIMKMADATKGDVVIVSSEHEGGQQLDGLGGIGALLRYKMR